MAKNLRCAFHPEQIVSNFCKSDKCLLPMCPRCIAIHTEEHRAQDTHGHFQSISDILKEVHDTVRNYSKLGTSAFETFETSASKQSRQIADIRKRVLRYRDKLLLAVERCFQQLNFGIERTLTELEVSLTEEKEQVRDILKGLEDNLENTLQMLNSPSKCLRSVITYFTQRQAESWEAELQKIEMRVRNVASPMNLRLVMDTSALESVVGSLASYLSLERIEEGDIYQAQSCTSRFWSSPSQKNLNKRLNVTAQKIPLTPFVKGDSLHQSWQEYTQISHPFAQPPLRFSSGEETLQRNDSSFYKKNKQSCPARISNNYEAQATSRQDYKANRLSEETSDYSIRDTHTNKKKSFDQLV